MRDGMYGVEYDSTKGDGTAGVGMCVLVLDNGRAFGADPWGAKYDGEYIFDESTRLAELRLKVTFPPNVQAVFGVSHPYEWSIDLTTQLNPHADAGQVHMATPVGRAIWEFSGIGNFSGIPGESDMILRNMKAGDTNAGKFLVYNISNGITGTTFLEGAVGLEPLHRPVPGRCC